MPNVIKVDDIDKFLEQSANLGTSTGGIAPRTTYAEGSKYDTGFIAPTDQYTALNRLQQHRAEEQPWTDQLGNAVARTALNIIPTIIGNTASILDVEDYVNIDNEFGNGVTRAMEDLKKQTSKNFPIYRRDPGKPLDIGDSAWWFENGSSLVESMGAFVATGMATGAVAKGLLGIAGNGLKAINAARTTKAINAATRAGKSTQEIQQITNAANTFRTAIEGGERGLTVLSNAVALNQAEGASSAMQVYDDTYKLQLAELNKKLGNLQEAEKQARQLASDAASKVININRLNIPLNLTSANLLTKPLAANRQILKELSKRKTLQTAGGEALQEGTEEIVNLIAETEGREKGLKGDKYTGSMSRIFDNVLSAKGAEAFLLGAVGGAGQTMFTAGAKQLNRKAVKDYKDRYNLQQEEIQRQQDYVGTRKQVIDGLSNVDTQINLIKQANKAILDGDEETLKNTTNLSLGLQANQALRTGTVQPLIGLYEAIRDEENVEQLEKEGYDVNPESPDYYKTKAKEAINFIEDLEKDYYRLGLDNKNKYENNDEVFTTYLLNKVVRNDFIDKRAEYIKLVDELNKELAPVNSLIKSGELTYKPTDNVGERKTNIQSQINDYKSRIKRLESNKSKHPKKQQVIDIYNKKISMLDSELKGVEELEKELVIKTKAYDKQGQLEAIDAELSNLNNVSTDLSKEINRVEKVIEEQGENVSKEQEDYLNDLKKEQDKVNEVMNILEINRKITHDYGNVGTYKKLAEAKDISEKAYKLYEETDKKLEEITSPEYQQQVRDKRQKETKDKISQDVQEGDAADLDNITQATANTEYQDFTDKKVNDKVQSEQDTVNKKTKADNIGKVKGKVRKDINIEEVENKRKVINSYNNRPLFIERKKDGYVTPLASLSTEASDGKAGLVQLLDTIISLKDNEKLISSPINRLSETYRSWWLASRIAFEYKNKDKLIKLLSEWNEDKDIMELLIKSIKENISPYKLLKDYDNSLASKLVKKDIQSIVNRIAEIDNNEDKSPEELNEYSDLVKSLDDNNRITVPETIELVLNKDEDANEGDKLLYDYYTGKKSFEDVAKAMKVGNSMTNADVLNNILAHRNQTIDKLAPKALENILGRYENEDGSVNTTAIEKDIDKSLDGMSSRNPEENEIIKLSNADKKTGGGRWMGLIGDIVLNGTKNDAEVKFYNNIVDSILNVVNDNLKKEERTEEEVKDKIKVLPEHNAGTEPSSTQKIEEFSTKDNNTQRKRPSFVNPWVHLSHEYKYGKGNTVLFDSEGNQLTWRQAVKENKLEPKEKFADDYGLDHDYLNNKLKLGDNTVTIFYEVDLDYHQNKDKFTFEKDEEGNNKLVQVNRDEFVIFVSAKDKEGKKHILGKVRGLGDISAKNPDVNATLPLLALRDKVMKRLIKAYNNGQNIEQRDITHFTAKNVETPTTESHSFFNSGITTKVTDIYTRPTRTKRFISPSEAIPEGTKIKFGYGKVKDNSHVIMLSNTESITANIGDDGVGAIYMLIPDKKNNLVPVRTFTKKVTEFPDTADNVRSIINEGIAKYREQTTEEGKEDALNEILENLDEEKVYMPLGFDSNGAVYANEGTQKRPKWRFIEDLNQGLNNIKKAKPINFKNWLDATPMQIDVSRLNTSNYNKSIDKYLKVNTLPGQPLGHAQIETSVYVEPVATGETNTNNITNEERQSNKQNDESNVLDLSKPKDLVGKVKKHSNTGIESTQNTSEKDKSINSPAPEKQKSINVKKVTDSKLTKELLKQEPEQTLEEISKKEYNDFIDKGIVTDERLESIANKVINNTELNKKELEIFTDKTKEVNTIIQEKYKLEETPVEQPQTLEQQIESQVEEVNPDDELEGDIFGDEGVDIGNSRTVKRGVPLWNSKQELKWLKDNLPNVPTSVVSNLKEIVRHGQDAWGIFYKAGIHLAENAGKGTGYHEGFHAVFNLFLNNVEKKQILDDAKKTYKAPTKEDLAKLSQYGDRAVEVYYEEKLADDFMEHVMTEETNPSLTRRINNFFKRIWSLIKSLFNKPVTNIDELFSRINSGYYRNAKPFVRNVNQFRDSELVYYRFDDWSSRDVKEVANNINGYIFGNLIPKLQETEKYSGKEPHEIFREEGILQLATQVYTQLSKYKSNIAKRFNEIKDVEEKKNLKSTFLKLDDAIQNFLPFNPKDKETFKYINKDTLTLTKEGFDFLQSQPLRNYPVFMEMVRGLGVWGMQVNPNAVNTEETNGDEVAIDKEESSYQENWVNSFYNRTNRDTVPNEIKHAIRLLKRGKMVNGKFVANSTELGLPEYVNYNATYGNLLHKLAGIFTSDRMMMELNNLTQYYPELIELYNKTQNDEVFKTKLFFTFSREHLPFYFLYQSKDRFGNKFRVTEANRKSLHKEILLGWKEDIYAKGKLINSQGINTKLAEKYYNDFIALGEELRTLKEGDIYDETGKIKTDIFDRATKLINDSGFAIEEDVVSYLYTSTKNTKNHGKAVALVADMLDGDQSFKKLFEGLKGNTNVINPEGGSGEAQTLDKLSKLVAKGTPNLHESSFKNVHNESVYSHIIPNFFALLNERIRTNSINKDYLNDSLYKDLPLIMDLVGAEGKESIPLVYGALDGLRYATEKEGSDTKEMSKKDIMVTGLNLFFNNKKKDTGLFKAPTLSDAGKDLVFEGRKYLITDATDILFQIAQNEYDRFQELQLVEEQLGVKMYNTESPYLISKFMEGIDGNPKDSKSRVKDAIKKWMDTKIDNYVELINKEGIIADKLLDDGISTTKDGLRRFVEKYFYSHSANVSQLMLLTSGDPIFYKNIEDYQKRNKQIWSPGYIIDNNALYKIDEDTYNAEYEAVSKRYGKKVADNIVSRDITPGVTYNSMYAKDVKIKAPSYDNLAKAIDTVIKDKNKADKIKKEYERVNLADAQAYVTLPRFRKVLVGLGRWTPLHQRAYIRMMNKQALEKDFIMFNAMKPFYFGHKVEDLNVGGKKKVIVTQNKNSEFILFPQMVEAVDNKGNEIFPELNKLHKLMLENNVDSMNFESAVKVGLNNAIEFDETTGTHKFQDFDPKKHIQPLNNSDFKLQMETPTHHIDSDSNFGSQYRKLIMSDLTPDGAYTIEGEKEGMSRDQLHDHYNELIYSNVKESYEAVKNELFAEGTPKQRNEKIRNLLIAEIRRTNRGADIEKLLEIGEDGEFIVPLWHPSISYTTQSLLNSIYKNNVTKQKTNGGSFIQVANYGQVSNGLRIETNPDGSIAYLECYLPWWSRKYYEPLLDENGQIDISKIEDESLLNLIGYRIPTEDKYSMAPLRVKGFLPQESGGGIMLPAEITTIAGSDFDVDKMYVMIPNFETYYKDGVQKIRKVKYDTDKSAEGVERRYDKKHRVYENKLKRINAVLDKVGKDYGIGDTATDKLATALVQYYEVDEATGFERNEVDEILKEQGYKGGVEYKDKIEKLAKAEEEIRPSLEEFSQLSISDQNTKEARDNRLLDIGRAVLNNPATTEAIVTPGGFEALRAIINKIRLLSEGYSLSDANRIVNNEDELKKVLNELNNKQGLNYLTPDTWEELTYRNLVGKALVGIWANHNAAHAIRQWFNLNFTYGINIDKDKAKEADNLLNKVSIVTDIEGNRISRNNSEFLAAVVDNAKDPLAVFGNINTVTSNSIAAILAVGLPMETAMMFIAQPSIKSYVELHLREGSKINEEEKNFSKIKNDIKQKLSKKVDLNNLPEITSKRLEKMLAEGAKVDKMTAEEKGKYAATAEGQDYYTFQYAVLNEFWRVKALGDSVAKLNRAMKGDTTNGAVGPSLADNEVLIRNIEAIYKDDFLIEGVEQILPKSMLQSSESTIYRNNVPHTFTKFGIVEANRDMNEFYPFMSQVMLSLKDEIEKNLLKGKTLNKQAISKINDEFITFLSTAFPRFKSVNRKSRAVILKTFPKEFSDYIAANPTLKKTNLFLRQLSYVDVTGNTKIPRIEFDNNQSRSNEEKEDIRRAWDDLFKDPNHSEFAYKLAEYSFWNAGFGFGPNSFSHILPAEYWLNYIIDNSNDFNKMLKTQMNYLNDIEQKGYFEKFIIQFYRHNADNSLFVPKAGKHPVTLTDANTKLQFKFTTNNIPPFVDNLGEGFYRPSRFLNKEINGKPALFVYNGGPVTNDTLVVYNERVELLGIPNYAQEYSMKDANPITIFEENEIPRVETDTSNTQADTFEDKSLPESTTEPTTKEEGTTQQPTTKTALDIVNENAEDASSKC